MSQQTTWQKPNAKRFGSVKLEVGADASTLVDLGAIRSAKFKDKISNFSVKPDNANELFYYSQGDKVSFTCLLLEVDLTTLKNLEGGRYTIATEAGSLVNNYSQVEAANSWAYNTFIKFDYQNSDGTCVNIDSVTAGTDGALVLNTDYITHQSADGSWGIMLIDGTKLTTLNQTITIQYDYTPAVSKTLTPTSFGNKTTVYARLTNTNREGKKMVIDISGVSNIKPIELGFVSDYAEDIMGVEIELEGYVVSIYDEQSVA